MSALHALHAEIAAFEDKLRGEAHHLGDRAHHLADEFRSLVAKLTGEAEADAADVVHTAETQGVVPAEHEAVTDAGTLAEHAIADAQAAVEGGSKPGA